MQYRFCWICLLSAILINGCDRDEEPVSQTTEREPLVAVSVGSLEGEIRSHFESEQLELVLEKAQVLRRLLADAEVAPEIKKIEGESLYLLANSSWQQGRFEEAFGRLDKAVRIFESLNEEEALANAFELKAVVAHDKGDLAGAEQQYLLAGSRYRALDLQEGLGRVLLAQATIACHRGTPSAAVGLLAEAQEIFEEAGFQRGLWGVLIQDGIRLHLSGDLSGAKERYLSALDLFKENKRFLASVLVNIGEVELEMGHPQKSLNFLLSARDLHKEMQDSAWVAYSELRVMESLAALGRFSEAQQIFRDIDLRGVEDQIIRAQLAMARNRLALLEAKLEGAEERSQRAIRVFEDYARPDDLAFARLQYGQILAMQGQLTPASVQLDLVKEQVAQTENLRLKIVHERLVWMLTLASLEPGQVEGWIPEAQQFLNQEDFRDHQLETFESLLAIIRMAGPTENKTRIQLRRELDSRFGELGLYLLVQAMESEGH